MEPRSPEARSLALLERAITLADEMFRATPKVPASEDGEEFQLVVAGFAVHGASAARGVLVLCREGLGHEALKVGRSLWEHVVDLRFIQTDRELLARRFILYDAVIRMRYVERAHERADTVWGRAFLERGEEVARAKSYFHAVLEEFADLGKSWAPGKYREVGERARAVGMKDEYLFLYSWLSERVHGSIAAIGDHWREGQGALLREPPDYALEAAASAAAWLSYLLEVYSEVYELDFLSQVDSLRSELMGSGKS